MAEALRTVCPRLAELTYPLTNKSKNKNQLTRDLLGPYWFLDKPRDLTVIGYIDGEETVVNDRKLSEIKPNQTFDIILNTMKGTNENETII